MKAIISLLAPVALVQARLRHNGVGDPASMVKATNASAPTCGVGYTYCGYILQQEKRGLLPPAKLQDCHD